jgi:hypothetical protein
MVDIKQKKLLESLLEKWSMRLNLEGIEINPVIRDDVDILKGGSCAESTSLLDFQILTIEFSRNAFAGSGERLEDIVIHELLHYKFQYLKTTMFDTLNMFRQIIPPYQYDHMSSQIVEKNENIVTEFTHILVSLGNEKAT